MNPRVTAVTPLAGHALLLRFNSGEQRRMDVSPYLAYPVFERLREPDRDCFRTDGAGPVAAGLDAIAQRLTQP